ncbi:hypothetical protein IE53DRAFT_47559 [Violaceomyces palustris]|uniref:Uncharacterized protein n=1 Tax=Violaceomyces palustris TaxID=1673888 RepID=A0ACD0P0E2_9BASI|nr:hypothetical protein IE53DRAFT_47559 [Violaceomyces palustris]
MVRVELRSSWESLPTDLKSHTRTLPLTQRHDGFLFHTGSMHHTAHREVLIRYLHDVFTEQIQYYYSHPSIDQHDALNTLKRTRCAKRSETIPETSMTCSHLTSAHAWEGLGRLYFPSLSLSRWDAPASRTSHGFERKRERACVHRRACISVGPPRAHG